MSRLYIEEDPDIYRVYDNIKATQMQERRRRARKRRPGETLLPPSVIEELRETTFRPLPEAQREINRKGLAEVRRRIASLEERRL